ncbi:hypothetical protein [Roseisalinus antarcticus]|uniref:Uncharacterized protein n=1 Tax=Roseisalinus antarcticus TaxID=254357 RepID=A0A1Y5T733_9RHOB|nr:hypothetical protein [Roseisalinus antarcticus]SLN54004.1 hypothetical protein ROA7023_02399 [Roseisalinus antarcticus]
MTAAAHAVLTGDLIASRTAGTAAVEAAMGALQSCARDLGDELGADLRFTRFRGDGWQLHLTDTSRVLDVMLALVAGLRVAETGLGTRIAAGLGPVETLGTADLSDATGEAFFVSGDLLERIGVRRRLAIGGAGIGPWQVAVVDLLDHIAFGWSAAQAEAVALAATPARPTQDEISGRLGITRQAVQARLAAAGEAHLQTALRSFRAHDYTAPGRGAEG